MARDEAAVMEVLNDLAVAGWLAPVPYPYGRADFAVFLRDFARAGETYAISDEGGFAGIITGGEELGYWLLPRAQGLGYATEAARAVLSAWFAAGGGNVVSGYLEGNHGSARVLEKLGFFETGRDMVYCRSRDRILPHVFLRLTVSGFFDGG